MEIAQILHMNRGEGETSYYRNSDYQQRVLLKARPILDERMAQICETTMAECLKIADLGCSSGPNSLLPIWEMIETIDSTCDKSNRKPPVLQVFLNDLPGTDFNTIFNSLVPQFHCKLMEKHKDRTPETCLISAMPGSFYTTLFPKNSLHFVHSSCALHWCSQVPEGLVTQTGVALNKGNICLNNLSPPVVHEKYLNQFIKDFTKFIKLRSEELISGGGMVLTLASQSVKNPFCSTKIIELIGLSLQDLVNEGKITQFMLDSYNVPVYAPASEVVRRVIENEGSFKLNGLEEFEIEWDIMSDKRENKILHHRGEYVAKIARAGGEQLLVNHFGDAIMDSLFLRVSMKAEKGLDPGNFLVISLTKK